MIVIIILIIALSALSAWMHPWVQLPGLPAPAASAMVAALFAVGICLPLGWLYTRRHVLDPDVLKRWWQAVLLGLAGAGCAAVALVALGLMFGFSSTLFSMGGSLMLLALGAGLWLGARGVVDWRLLWSLTSETKAVGRPKLLDTSVLIDGRISELVETGFIE